MSDPSPQTVTRLLLDWRAGDARALDELMPQVYDELRRLARRHMRGEREGHTLGTTALLHEAYVHLVQADVGFNDRAHFYALAAQQMRRILVDHARARGAAKRGAAAHPVTLDSAQALVPGRAVDLLDLDRALSRLTAWDARRGCAVELRFFGGMTHEEIAVVLGVSVSTVRQDLRVAQAWLASELAP